MKKTLMSAVMLVAMMGNAEAQNQGYLNKLKIGTQGHLSSLKAGTLDFLSDWNKSDYYLGILVSNSDISGETGIGEDMSVVSATFGYVFPGRLSLEARFGLGSDQADSLLQDPVTQFSAAMLRYHYTWNHNVMAYASVGAALRNHSSALDVNDVQAGAAVAVGLNLFGSDTTALNLEYLYLGGADPLSSIGIGFHRYFGKY